MDEVKIPEDLTVHHKATKANRHNVGTWSDMFVRGLIERIARAEAQVAALTEQLQTANKELALWRSEHDPCPFALENERLTEQVRVLSQAEELLGDVSHLWLDGYISKNPKSAAPKEISEEVFAKVTSYLRTAGIEVDYTGWSRIAARSAAPGKVSEDGN